MMNKPPPPFDDLDEIELDEIEVETENGIRFAYSRPSRIIPASTEDIELMQRLAQAGMQLARRAADRAKAKYEAQRIGTATQEDVESHSKDLDDFERYARAVRMSIAAKAQMRVDPRLEKRPPESPALKQRKEAARRKRQFKQEIRVRTIAAEVISSTQARKKLDIVDEIDTWFIRASIDTEVLDLPVGVLVARICHDFGVSPDWQRWKDKPWTADAVAATARWKKA